MNIRRLFACLLALAGMAHADDKPACRYMG